MKTATVHIYADRVVIVRSDYACKMKAITAERAGTLIFSLARAGYNIKHSIHIES